LEGLGNRDAPVSPVAIAVPARKESGPVARKLHWLIWAAEGAGTALLVLGALSAIALVLGSGSPLAAWSGSARLLVTGLLVGTCVALLVISPLGRLSGAHLNPAVTLAFWVVRMASGRDLIGYVGAQLVGALAGALTFRWLWGGVALSVGGGVTRPSVAIWEALCLEAGMTALLVVMIFLFVSHERLARWTPLMLVPVLAVLIWKGSPYTGTSLNPARSEGPAVAFADFADLWLYFLGPIIGALTVAAVWRQRDHAAQPKTAKLFHDPSYPCSLRSELAVRGLGTSAVMSENSRPKLGATPCAD
jgi:aquaporin Z